MRFWRIIAVVCGLGCCLVLAAWGRSYFVCDDITTRFIEVPRQLGALENSWKFSASAGRFRIVRQITTNWAGPSAAPNVRQTDWQKSAPSALPPLPVNRWGLQWEASRRNVRTGSRTTFALDVSYLVLLAPCFGALLLAVNLARHRHTRASALLEKRCFACGYDLRATPDRCPECGAVPLWSARALEPEAKPQTATSSQS
jgi:hypothetical protein